MKQNQVSLKKKAMAWILSICLIVTLIPDISFAVTGSKKNAVSTSEKTSGNKIVEKMILAMVRRWLSCMEVR